MTPTIVTLLLIVPAMIGVSIWMNRNNWFQREQDKKGGYIPPVPSTTPLQPTAQQQPVATASANQTATSSTPWWGKLAGAVLGVLLILWSIPFIWTNWPSDSSSRAGATVTRSITPTYGAVGSEEAVLAQICGCESNGGIAPGRQLDDEGNVITNPTSRAKGACQIHPDNFVEAEEMGLDLDIESDNREFARYLYRRDGTAPWTASVACWAPFITTSGALVVTLEAPVEGWAEYPFEPGFIANIDPLDSTKKYREEIRGYQELNGVREPFSIVREHGFPVKESEFRLPGVAKFLRVQSLEEEPVIIKITLTPKT